MQARRPQVFLQLNTNMARTKKIKEEVKPIPEEIVQELDFLNKKVDILAHEFSNGELNILRDKINEIIKYIS